MQDYTYKYGDKPLEGYTIQRAAGRGGFGEVYYALSDSGRQVALKTVHSHEQIELRGIKQCMNLKSPHLVSIFDVKYNDRGRPFVIMEFVSGMSLRDLLNENPEGIGPQKSAFFLREIAKGLSHLHDCGIVHRDLKPGNIFYENGCVKIGDYGLTKAISTSQHSGQTVTVGTVHYMAPEIGEGCYDFSIDIYALGILLYEMLTGQVPFFGASPAEILMKHMSTTPNLDDVDEPFARVIRKALAKDPKERYQTVQEMIEDVFGTEHIRQSVSQFSPESLSMIAERVAQKAKIDDTPPASDSASPHLGGMPKMGEQIGRQLGEAGERLANKVSQAANRFERHLNEKTSGSDPVSQHQRKTLTLITIAVISAGVGVLSGPLNMGINVFLTIIGASLGLRLAKEKLLVNFERGAFRNVMAAGLALAGAGLLSGVIWANSGHFSRHIGGTLWAVGVVLAFFDTWRLTDPGRRERINWGVVISASILGFIASTIFTGHPVLAAGILAGTLMAIQVGSPFGGPSAKPSNAKHARTSQKRGRHRSCERRSFFSKESNMTQAQANDNPHPQSGDTQGVHQRPVPSGLRLLFTIGFVIFLGTGISLLVMCGATRMGNDEFAMVMAFGFNSLIAALLCLIKITQKTFVTWYRYLIKPLFLCACLGILITSSVILANIRLGDEETAIGIICIVFPAILFLFTCFIPARFVEELIGERTARPPRPVVKQAYSELKKSWALLLALPIYFPAGLHRLYAGKYGTAVIWFLTGGLGGIGQIIDIIMILSGRFKDAEGRRLMQWFNEPVTVPPVPPVPPVPNTQDHSEQGSQEASPTSLAAEASQSVHAARITHASSVWRAVGEFNPIGRLFSILGHLILFGAIVLSLLAAVNVHWLIHAGFPDPGLAGEIAEVLKYNDWPRIIDRIVPPLQLGILVIGSLLIVIGRRVNGIAHMTRAVVGTFFLLQSLIALDTMLPADYFMNQTVANLWHTQQYGLAIENLLNAISTNAVSWAGFYLVFSVVFLAWPVKKQIKNTIKTTSSENGE
jgi:serine/threonine protein kinase